MPFVPMTKQQQELQPNQGVNISGGQGANFADVVPGQEKKEKSSGQYANLQQYVSANQPQAQQMGAKVAQGVEQAGQEAQQKVEQFGQQKPTVAAFDPNQYIQNAPQLSQEQKQTYQQTKSTGGYSGPQSIEQAQGYTEAQKASQSASDKAKMAATEVGQQELLRQSYSRPSYTQGETKLDQVLLGGNQQSKQNLANLSQKYSGLSDLFGTKAQEVGQGINESVQQALRNRENIVTAEGQAWNDLVNPIQQRADQYNAQRPQMYQNLYNDLLDDALLEETLSKLGLQEGQSLYDLNLGDYISPNETVMGLNDLANQDERTKYKALADLFQDQSRTQLSDTGSIQKDVNFEKEKFMSDVGKRQQSYGEVLNQPSAVAQGKTIAEAKEMIPQIQSYIDSYKAIGSGAALASAEFYQDVLNKILAEQSAVNSYNPNRVIRRQT